MMIKNYSKLGVLIMLIAFALLGWFAIQSKAKPPVENNPQARAIQQTLINAYNIISESNRSGYSTARFSEVFIDDEAHKIAPRQERVIQDTLGEDALQGAGYLTAMTAKHQARANARALAHAENQAREESRSVTPEEIAEIQETHHTLPPVHADEVEVRNPNQSEQGVSLPSRPEAKQVKDFDWVSLEVDGDRAIITYDDGMALQEATMVRVKGKWYVADITPIHVHF